MSADPAITLADVTFAYGSDEPTVLEGVDLEIPRGAVTVIVGASGGGKSTLLSMLNGLIPSFITGEFTGSILADGTDLTATRTNAVADKIGMVLQDYEAQLFGTSITAEVAFGPENLGVDPVEIDARIDRALQLTDLTDLDRRRPPSSLSGGQKQRLVIAGVAAMEPTVMILDEPTSDLDPAGTEALLSVLHRVQGTDPAAGWTGPETVVMVTHAVEEAIGADHIIMLADGAVAASGPAEVVLRDAAALRAARVGVPPLVTVFDALGVGRDALPLTPRAAESVVETAGFTYDPTVLPAGAPAETGADPGAALFSLEEVSYAYATDREPVVAVDAVDLVINRGAFVALIGHNGSGKSTLSKLLHGLLEPSGGSVTLDGSPLSSYSATERGRQVGYVFQNPDHQLFAETVREEVAFGPSNFGYSGQDLDDRVTAALETVDLTPLAQEDPFKLSRGQRQRVALAGILATDPGCIIFDEPTTGLDATQHRQFMQLVGRLNRREGLTVIMITHDMGTVARYAPRAVVMDAGRVVFDGATRALFADPELLARYQLRAPQVTRLAHRLAPDAPPALSEQELISALGGPQ
jgi:energy-coupling factor transport system ATP-binding protein